MVTVTLKVKFKAFHRGNKEGCIGYQVIDGQKTRCIYTEYRLFSNEWNRRKACPIVEETERERKEYLLSLYEKIQKDMRELEEVVLLLRRKETAFSADDVVLKYLELKENRFFFTFMRKVIGQLRDAGKIRTGETYAATLNSLIRFRDGRDFSIEELTSGFLLSYETWLKSQGVSMNTVSFYMRILRAVNNRAVAEGIVEQRYPFKQVYTGNEKTVKRAVTLEVIKELKALDYPTGSPYALARDMFLFSFYTRGMSFIDMAFLRKVDLSDGVLSYRRQKTGQRLFIKWEPCMQELAERYGEKHSPYLLSLIRRPGENERRQYLSESHRITRNLKTIGKTLGLSSPLTMYVARHAWASIAKSKNIPGQRKIYGVSGKFMWIRRVKVVPLSHE